MPETNAAPESDRSNHPSPVDLPTLLGYLQDARIAYAVAYSPEDAKQFIAKVFDEEVEGPDAAGAVFHALAAGVAKMKAKIDRGREAVAEGTATLGRITELLPTLPEHAPPEEPPRRRRNGAATAVLMDIINQSLNGGR